MSKQYQYITISVNDLRKPIGNKPVYSVNNTRSGDFLCGLEYYPRWRQYVMSNVGEECVFNKDCLRDIIDFIENHAGKREAENE